MTNPRVLIIKGKDTELQFPETDGVAFSLTMKNVALTVEAHNALFPDDHWIWGELGTQNDPTIVQDK